MIARRKTIEQLANSIKVEFPEVVKIVQDVLLISKSDARNRHFYLSALQVKQVTDFIDKSKQDKIALKLSEKSLVTNLKKKLIPVPLDPMSIISELQFGALNHNLWVHTEVLESIQKNPALRKRLGLILQHLGSHGRTSIVKSCKNEFNRGWLRSPLGGNNGMAYYLWWTPQGSYQIKNSKFLSSGIVIRAVREHDDHSPLKIGESENFLPFTQLEIDDDGLVGRPWTSDQQKFVEATDPVRLVVGRPGSGKTTVLWKAIESRGSQRLLYLTWSRELCRLAEEHLKAFAPSDVQVVLRDFLTFLGEICKKDIKRQTLNESLAIFQTAIKHLGPDVLGVWKGREKALYAEIRAFLIGRAIPFEDFISGLPDESNLVFFSGLVRLKDDEYVNLRGNSNGVGATPAETLLKIFGLIEPAKLSEIFPELAASLQAIEILKTEKLPEGWASFDRVVIDEVQDLTLLESNVFVELCRAIARDSERPPKLLVAGDDGQTVRPSGFIWGNLKDLIARRISTPKDFILEENLRCPHRIANVIERASNLYTRLEKDRRPTKQGQQSEGQPVEAYLFHVSPPNITDAISLLEQLKNVEGTVIVSSQDEIPDWVPESLRINVLIPAETKGLEYQSVCVLDPGKTLIKLKSARKGSIVAELEESYFRTTIDQLRVSLSRATESLIFIDVEATEESLIESRKLLDHPAPYEPGDLLKHFLEVDVSPEERVVARINDARTLINERPLRAWHCANQAVCLLGNPNLPNGVANKNIRLDAQRTFLSIASRLLLEGLPIGVTKSEVKDAADTVLKDMNTKAVSIGFEELFKWSNNQSLPPFDLLNAVISLAKNGDWLSKPLVAVAQNLRKAVEDSAINPKHAKVFVGEISEWLKLTGYAGDTSEEERQLRCKSFDTLMGIPDYLSAQKILKRIKPSDPFRAGRLLEAQGRYEEAAKTFEEAKSNRDALRNWRFIGNLKKAVRLAEGTEKVDLQWLIKLEDLLSKAPHSHHERLTKGEKDHYNTILSIYQAKKQEPEEMPF